MHQWKTKFTLYDRVKYIGGHEPDFGKTATIHQIEIQRYESEEEKYLISYTISWDNYAGDNSKKLDRFAESALELAG